MSRIQPHQHRSSFSTKHHTGFFRNEVEVHSYRVAVFNPIAQFKSTAKSIGLNFSCSSKMGCAPSMRLHFPSKLRWMHRRAISPEGFVLPTVESPSEQVMPETPLTPGSPEWTMAPVRDRVSVFEELDARARAAPTLLDVRAIVGGRRTGAAVERLEALEAAAREHPGPPVAEGGGPAQVDQDEKRLAMFTLVDNISEGTVSRGAVAMVPRSGRGIGSNSVTSEKSSM